MKKHVSDDVYSFLQDCDYILYEIKTIEMYEIIFYKIIDNKSNRHNIYILSDIFKIIKIKSYLRNHYIEFIDFIYELNIIIYNQNYNLCIELFKLIIK